MQESIVNTASELLMARGLTDWSVEKVAKAAGCAKGLVHYHFGTKDTLLGKVLERLEFERQERRLTALSGAEGAAALDELWQVLVTEVRAGSFGAWIDCLRYFGPRAGGLMAAADDRLSAAAARALGEPEASLVEAAALLGPAMDGFQFRLHSGEDPARVREGFDRVWLGVL